MPAIGMPRCGWRRRSPATAPAQIAAYRPLDHGPDIALARGDTPHAHGRCAPVARVRGAQRQPRVPALRVGAACAGAPCRTSGPGSGQSACRRFFDLWHGDRRHAHLSQCDRGAGPDRQPAQPPSAGPPRSCPMAAGGRPYRHRRRPLRGRRTMYSRWVQPLEAMAHWLCRPACSTGPSRRHATAAHEFYRSVDATAYAAQAARPGPRHRLTSAHRAGRGPLGTLNHHGHHPSNLVSRRLAGAPGPFQPDWPDPSDARARAGPHWARCPRWCSPAKPATSPSRWPRSRPARPSCCRPATAPSRSTTSRPTRSATS